MPTNNLLEQFHALVEEVNREAECSDELRLLATSLEATEVALNALKQQRNDISKAWFLKCDEFLEFKELRDSLTSD